MHGIWKAIGSFVRRADMVLLSLCVAASVFGIVVISSATNVKGSAQFVRAQIAGADPRRDLCMWCSR